MKENPHKVKAVTHDIQGRPFTPEVSAVITKMAQNLSDKGWEVSQKKAAKAGGDK